MINSLQWLIVQDQIDECERKLTDSESKLADQTVRERIRDVEKAQSIAELKQVISNLEFQVRDIHQHRKWKYFFSNFIAEPATHQEFWGKGSTNELGRHDVKFAATGNHQNFLNI